MKREERNTNLHADITLRPSKYRLDGELNTELRANLSNKVSTEF